MHTNLILDEVVYEEVETVVEHHIIETGDSVKVKQVLDDATLEAVTNAGYIINYHSENVKLFLMFLSCVAAMVAQFYPIPFPQSRPLLGVCCALYFILSTVLQYIMSFVDRDTIIITKPDKVSNEIPTHMSCLHHLFLRHLYTLIVLCLTSPHFHQSIRS